MSTPDLDPVVRADPSDPSLGEVGEDEPDPQDHKYVKEAISGLWGISDLPKDSSGRLRRPAYLMLMRKLYYALVTVESQEVNILPSSGSDGVGGNTVKDNGKEGNLDNEALLSDPLYTGVREPRLKGDEYFSLVDEFVQAVFRRYPKALLQFEDFSSDKASVLLG